MPATDSTNEPVERFAVLCAALEDGFAVRADVLAAVGLDEAGWQSLRDQWLPYLATTDAPDFALSFTRAYGRARQHRAPKAAERGQRDVALTEGDADDTLVDARCPALDDPDVTAAVAFPLAGPALPFTRAFFGQPAVALGPPEAPEPAHRLPPGHGHPVDATLEVSCAPLAADAALPFSHPPATGRRQRLVRFDPHTGHPLAAPRWVEESIPSPSVG
jgi:hypothetical protein